MNSIRENMRQFVVDNFLFGQPGGLSDEDSFLEKGIIDSTGVLELISYLEKTFEIRLEDSELVPENLDSIDNLVHFVHNKLGMKEGLDVAGAGISGEVRGSAS